LGQGQRRAAGDWYAYISHPKETAKLIEQAATSASQN
jgi:hypothetical protein